MNTIKRKKYTQTSQLGGNAGWVLVPRTAFNQLTQAQHNLMRLAQNIGTAGTTGGLTGTGRRGRPPANAI